MQIQLTLNITSHPTTTTTLHSPTIKALKKTTTTFSDSPPISFYQEGHNIRIEKKINKYPSGKWTSTTRVSLIHYATNSPFQTVILKVYLITNSWSVTIVTFHSPETMEYNFVIKTHIYHLK